MTLPVVLAETATVAERFREAKPAAVEHAMWCLHRMMAHVDAGRTTEAYASMARDLAAYEGDRADLAPFRLHQVVAAVRGGRERTWQVLADLGLLAPGEGRRL